jgi:hypothetical protein
MRTCVGTPRHEPEEGVVEGLHPLQVRLLVRAELQALQGGERPLINCAKHSNVSVLSALGALAVRLLLCATGARPSGCTYVIDTKLQPEVNAVMAPSVHLTSCDWRISRLQRATHE